jgi:signal transduction histidine kinase
MNKIVSDLQDYSVSIKPKPASVDLQQLISETISISRVPENVTVSTSIPQDVFTVNIDSAIVRRVLINLITNAVQAMPDGGKLNLKVYRKNKPPTLVVSLEDTGIGIPKTDRCKIFTPLFTTKAKGQGLGLSVCKRLVEACNGTISFESRVGKGSKFTIKLPLR